MVRIPFVLAAIALLLGGCSAVGSAGSATDSASPVATQAHALPLLTVQKHPTCGCCSVWIEHVREAGFEVEARDVEDMAAVKDAAGVPDAMASCHTAEVGGYFIEGHVPAADIARLLRERPAARGLAVPGMPLGSPGMEHPDGIAHPYAVMLVLEDGSTREFSSYPRD
ncbi:DUF411 domain-containing protein [Luteimonas sp. A482]